LDFLSFFFLKIQSTINNWWPWTTLWDDIFLIQFFIVCTYIYMYTYRNIYYVLLYVFVNFFLMGVYLSIYQIELFSAFLWLVECSVIFVFLLLLFYINVKGIYTYTTTQNYVILLSLFFLLYAILLNPYSESDNSVLVDMCFYGLLDNYYEALYNTIPNDLFGFSISYYFLNAVEFLFIGFLLLVGSVVCVNLYSFNKNVRVQNLNNHLLLFNFFLDFTSFLFLRKQNPIKQGNNKASLKIFKKK